MENPKNIIEVIIKCTLADLIIQAHFPLSSLKNTQFCSYLLIPVTYTIKTKINIKPGFIFKCKIL